MHSTPSLITEGMVAKVHLFHLLHATRAAKPYLTSQGAEGVMWVCVQACVTGMFELKEDSAFKQHLRDFLVQTKSFADKNNADLFAEEAAAQREVPTCHLFGDMQFLLPCECVHEHHVLLSVMLRTSGVDGDLIRLSQCMAEQYIPLAPVKYG